MDKFTSKHLFFLILGTTVISMKTYPNVFIKYGGRDSWICVTIASILIILFFLLLIRICEKYNCFSMYKIYCSALGKVFGTILIYFFILMMIVTLVECSCAEGSSMHTNMLLETPTWFISVFFIFPGIYAVKKGKVAIVTTAIIGVTLIMIAGINLFFLTAKYKHLSYILPIMQEGITKNFIFSIFKSLALYGSVAIVIPYLNEIEYDSKMKKNALIALLTLVQMEIVATMGVIVTFDVPRTEVMSYPKLLQTQLVSHFGFLESGELFVMLQILGGWFLKYTLTLLSINILLKEMNIHNKYVFYILGVITYIATFFISKNLLTVFSFYNVYIYLSFINFIVIPLIVFCIFSIRKNLTTKSS